MNMTVFWDDALCSLLEIYRRVRSIALMMDTVNTSETQANFYQTTRRNSPEDSHVLTRRLFGQPVVLGIDTRFELLIVFCNSLLEEIINSYSFIFPLLSVVFTIYAKFCV
jgi:hypothetical protein